MKQILDIIFSFIALLVFALPITIIVFLLTFKEKHPIFFRQNRIGKNKKSFEILKFQTMVNQVPTYTGQFLRKTGLDELPQFLNVLKGDMSIVGPRALTQFDIERLYWNDKFHKVRWDLNLVSRALLKFMEDNIERLPGFGTNTISTTTIH